MTPNRLEHVNITLTDLDRATRALQAIVPDWSVRGTGRWDDGSGHSSEWRHVGDDFQYLSLYETPPGRALKASGAGSAFNHLALVVDDLDAALARLQAMGVPLDHIGGGTAHRRSAYVRIEPERLEIELVAYDSGVPSERNVYA
jgi:catechol 2,3-dioxygenase-like lactoylglutathione lyase family enzyme